MNEKNPSLTVYDKLKEHYPTSSKNSMKQWIEEGRVKVNKEIATRLDAQVKQKDKVTLTGQKAKHSEGVTIVYEDPYIVVINKPSGILSVATDFEKKDTAHAVLKRKYAHKKIYVVHRLDQETSGLMVFALDQKSFQFLKAELAERKVKRIYQGVVEGSLEGKGTWSCYLQEDGNFYVHASDNPAIGELAITHYEVLNTTPQFSRVQFTLQTGKKNQIRVQSARSGHPITGDVKYDAKRNPLKRLALHATSLSFTHPISKKRLTFTSPVPNEWMKLCKKSKP